MGKKTGIISPAVRDIDTGAEGGGAMLLNK
jgi:hypothetical protein